MITELPAGLDVYGILMLALQNVEYRDKLLFLIGSIFGAGFLLGFVLCAIFVNPSNEVKARQYDREHGKSGRRR